MKISELMKRLTTIKDLNGDLDIYIDKKGENINQIYIFSDAQEIYETSSIKELKNQGKSDSEIKNLMKKYVIIQQEY